VLIKKASVDPAFKDLLIETRAEAAKAIDLQLDADEAMLLAAIPPEQLEAFIRRTHVPDGKKAAFLGKVAAAMLIALGAVAGCEGDIATQGVRPDDTEEKATAASRPAESETQPTAPPAPQGIRPDAPETTTPASQPGRALDFVHGILSDPPDEPAAPVPGDDADSAPDTVVFGIRGPSRGIRPDYPTPDTQPATDNDEPTSQPESQPATQPDSQPATQPVDDATPDDDSDRVDRVTRGIRW